MRNNKISIMIESTMIALIKEDWESDFVYELISILNTAISMSKRIGEKENDSRN